MATLISGKKQRIRLDGVVIAKQTNWSIGISGEYPEATYYESTDTEFGELIGSAYTWSFSGFYSKDDTNGLLEVETAAISGTKLATLTFDLDGVTQWGPDVASNSISAAIVKSFNMESGEKEWMKVSADGVFSGAIFKSAV